MVLISYTFKARRLYRKEWNEGYRHSKKASSQLKASCTVIVDLAGSVISLMDDRRWF